MLELIKINYKNDFLIEKFSDLAFVFIREYYTPLIGEEAVENMLYFNSHEIIKDEIKEQRYECFLIKKENQNIGIVQLQQQSENCNISKIFILKKYRKKGLGKMVINELSKIRSNLKICIEAKNKRLLNIISKCNFKYNQEIARYVGNNIYIYENVYFL